MPMPPEEFVSALRAVGDRKYHHLPPFHVRMNAGELSPEEIVTPHLFVDYITLTGGRTP